MEQSSGQNHEQLDVRELELEAHNEYVLEMHNQSHEFIDTNLYQAARSLAEQKNYKLRNLYDFGENGEFSASANLPYRDGTVRRFDFTVYPDIENGTRRNPCYNYTVEWSEQSEAVYLQELPLETRKHMRDAIIVATDERDDDEELLDALAAPAGEIGEDYENIRCYTQTEYSYSATDSAGIINKSAGVVFYFNDEPLYEINSAEDYSEMDLREIEDDFAAQDVSREDTEMFMTRAYELQSINEDDLTRMKEALYYIGLEGGEIEADITERWNDERSVDIHE